MHFSSWIQIWYWKFEFGKFWGKSCTILTNRLLRIPTKRVKFCINSSLLEQYFKLALTYHRIVCTFWFFYIYLYLQNKVLQESVLFLFGLTACVYICNRPVTIKAPLSFLIPWTVIACELSEKWLNASGWNRMKVKGKTALMFGDNVTLVFCT